MFRKRYRQQVPELNTTSTADISFMLLIFFLVTSSMDTDKGILRQMAPPPQEHEQPMDVNKDHVMRIELDADDHLTCDGKPVTEQQLSDEVFALASVNPAGHILSINADRQTTYDAYFRMQNAVVSAYAALRDCYAREHYGHAFTQCSAEERDAIVEHYPQRISEQPLAEGQKGGRP